MTGALKLVLLVLLHGAVLGGLLAVVLGLGGNFILLGLAVLVAWVGKFEHLGFRSLAVLGGLVVLGEVVEAVLGLLVARGFGASRWGMIGTLIGGLVGAVAGTGVFPVVGSLIGAFVGAFAGAFGGELLGGKPVRPSLRAGLGAFLGRAAASAAKLAIGAVLGFVTLRAAYTLV